MAHRLSFGRLAGWMTVIATMLEALLPHTDSLDL